MGVCVLLGRHDDDNERHRDRTLRWLERGEGEGRVRGGEGCRRGGEKRCKVERSRVLRWLERGRGRGERGGRGMQERDAGEGCRRGREALCGGAP